MSLPRVVHVLWSPQSGPICAYEDPSMAWDHARTMLGVEVSSVEIAIELPEIVKQAEYDDDETTPIEVDEIDDAPGK